MNRQQPSEDDLNSARSSLEIEPKKDSAQILRHELREALAALERPPNRLFLSGLSAGLEIGLSLLLVGVMKTLAAGELSRSAVEILVANMYSFGFILIVLGRSELFTEQTSLAVMPVLNRLASVGALLRLWTVVYIGNLSGAAAIAGLLAFVGPRLDIIEAETFGELAHESVRHSGPVILLSGILAGWLMGLLSWLVAAGRDTISQIVIVWMIASAIGLAHLHHCVLGSVEVLAGVFSGRGASLGEFGHFLAWATLGNALGGPVFVALLKFSHARPRRGERVTEGLGS